MNVSLSLPPGDAPAAPVAAAPSKGQKRAIQQPAGNSTEIQEEKQRLKEVSYASEIRVIDTLYQ